MSETRTGGFAIGFRRLSTDWQQDLGQTLAWARDNGFAAIDLLNDGDRHAAEVQQAGLRLGSVDLPDWKGMLSVDTAKRQEALARNADYVRACSAAGPVKHFTVMVPENPELGPAENYGFMVASYGELADALEEAGAKLVIEGWPGPGALCCTPESLRAFFKDCPSPSLGFNYDPSHLIRMGIDPLRFLEEFKARVFHVHAKDTEVQDEGLYEYGHQQPAVFSKRPRWGGPYWRYTLPGHGVMRWTKAFKILAEAGYEGCVSIELEDIRFNGAEETERLGLQLARTFLEGC